MPRFDIINPIHRKQCHNMKKSLINYYVATCTIQTLKSDDLKCRNHLEQVILTKYDRLLSICRCFQLKLEWKENQIGVIVNCMKQEMIGIQLETLLIHMVKHGFERKPWPIILVLDCQNLILDNRMNELITVINNILPMQQIFSKSTAAHETMSMKQLKLCLPTFLQNSNQIAWPSLHSLCQKFVVIIKQSDSKSTVLMTANNNSDWDPTIEIQPDLHHPNESNIERLANEKCCILSFDSQRIIDSIERDRNNYLDDSIASLTSKAFTWCNFTANYYQSSSYNSIDWIRMGIQCIPYTVDDDHGYDGQLCRSLFDTINGSCGYVLKPSPLRHGHMYSIGFSEDRSLPGEPSAGPTRFLLKLYCIEDLMKFDPCTNPMRCKVVVQIIGYHEDNCRYHTKTCCTEGQIPFWDEQIRPVIRLPNFTFIRFEVYNCERLVADRTIPFKAMMRGMRYISLVGRDGCHNNGKLFVHSNFKKIASCWSPDFLPNTEMIGEKPQKHSIDYSDMDFIDADDDDGDQN
ncbi:hypothetical protein BLA29_000431 [Euroglyphus maynei]|uniref:PI-PLC Y-box domain-containing protein n=1 Tax=Euroglyphus maynei TaxID=6958 RepID=A0A1Y3ARN5_EURMA|nr:hypothetical protein BLA29_000431 [Euroglyphus maynei]